MVWRSSSVYIPSLNHDFKHSSSSIVSIEQLNRCSVNVCFTPENIRSGSDNIVGIEKTLIAIFERKGSRDRYSEVSY